MRFLFVLICLAPLGAARAVPANPKEKTHLVKAAELISTIREADKIVVYDSRFAIYGDEVPSHIYSSENPQDISELRESIAIEPPNGWFRCACIPPVDIILSRRGRQIGVISVQENLTIGFSHWSGDARIADKEKFLHWFDVRGITGPRRGIDRISAEENADRVASDRWIRAMPLNLRPLWPKVV